MNGFINVNKAAGVTSAQEVNKIKRLSGTRCGHMGTLDPMASGVLPVAVGNAARLFDYFLKKSKTYVAEFTFGEESDTLDSTGNILKRGGRIPAAVEIESVLKNFIGEINQIPPLFSAKNVNGKRGYMLAREGAQFELPPKTVKIHSIKLTGQPSERTFTFEIVCGGGTYIRSLARDISASLGTYAVMSGLVRTRSGVFDLKSSVKTADLTAENLQNYLIPTESVIDLQKIFPNALEAKKLFNGLSLECGLPEGVYKIYCAGKTFYGLAEVKKGYLKVVTKLC